MTAHMKNSALTFPAEVLDIFRLEMFFSVITKNYFRLDK